MRRRMAPAPNAAHHTYVWYNCSRDRRTCALAPFLPGASHAGAWHLALSFPFLNMRNLTFVAVTQINPALQRLALGADDGLGLLVRTPGEFAEHLVEFAGRLRDGSTTRVGSPPGFAATSQRAGHESDLEHVWATLLWLPLAGEDISRLQRVNPHLQVREIARRPNGPVYLVTANGLTWRDVARHREVPGIGRLLYRRWPRLFGEFAHTSGGDLELQVRPAPLPERWETTLGPRPAGTARVTLLGFQIVWGYPALNSASFLLEGVSRALVHELRQLRLGCLSEASPRCMDLHRGFIAPPALQANPGAYARLVQTWERLDEDQQALRDEYNIPPGDLRYFWPGAVSTRVMVTMGLSDWRHFVEQGTLDPATPWEVRRVATALLDLLHELDPVLLDHVWRRVAAARRAETVAWV